MRYEGSHPEDCDCEFHAPRCTSCSARVTRDEADAAPAQVLCVDCIGDIAATMTPPTLESLRAELRALGRFGFGFEHSAVRELVWAIDSAEATPVQQRAAAVVDDFMNAPRRIAAVDDARPGADLGLAVAS